MSRPAHAHTQMPPARPVLILLAFVALPTFFTFFTLLSAHPRHGDTESAPSRSGTIRSFFSFHSPSTLFPPSAIISLTDDNSTFFLARPADFGPRLVSDGFSGQLWVGSGFGDDNIRKGGAATGPEGELGCSDVPGWENGDQERHGDVSFSRSWRRKVGLSTKDRSLDDSPIMVSDSQDYAESVSLIGTDDHLHYPLPDTQISKAPRPGQPTAHLEVADGTSAHADIQSLQETAEITGKIVLLSRGGCGFLEKVKWAQRRGAAALIVGDDTRGGALVTMYARGDTSNISIPSLFTSHTTAHLLSSLIPSQSDPDDDDSEAIPDTELTEGSMSRIRDDEDRPTFTAAPRPTSTTVTRRKPAGSMNTALSSRKKVPKTIQRVGNRSIWQRLGFGKSHQALGLGEDSRRPPSSGRLNWVNEDINEEFILKRTTAKTSIKSKHNAGDGFEIGVQDWRDPDFVATKSIDAKNDHKTNTKAVMPTSSKSDTPARHGSTLASDGNGFAGGSITPGSGEYGHNPSNVDTIPNNHGSSDQDDNDQTNWLSHALWGESSETGTEDTNTDGLLNSVPTSLSKPSSKTAPKHPQSDAGEHEGLWITLTPTTMSTTPFFDTLLVLVVSPLITLTVVYALLLLRSRIRRRRWRAPKSVVERLPVRTYQTMPTSSTTSSTRMATPFASSPTSPLLQSRSQSLQSRSRAESKADSEAGEMIPKSLDKEAAQAAIKQREKPRASATKKYSGRQVECVVCLEEYVEGHSQVMSLPCGHEFHAECM